MNNTLKKKGESVTFRDVGEEWELLVTCQMKNYSQKREWKERREGYLVVLVEVVAVGVVLSQGPDPVDIPGHELHG